MGTNANATRPESVHRAQRGRTIRATALSSMALRVVAAGSTFIFFPLVLRHLGADAFGIWATVVSFTTLFAFADLGIGNGIISPLAAAFGRDNRDEIARLLADGLAIGTAIAVCVLLSGAVILYAVDWPPILDKWSVVPPSEIRAALAWFFVSFATSIPGTLVYRAQVALQRGHVAASWQIAGVLCSCVAVVVSTRTNGTLSDLIVAQMLPPALAGLANLLHFVLRSTIRVRVRNATVHGSQRLLKTGGFFFLMQLSMAIAFSSDILLITWLRGSTAAAAYAVTAKLFSIASIMIGAYAQSLWPAYAEAHARDDVSWIRHQLGRTLLLLPTAASAFGLALILAWTPVTEAWLSTPPALPDHLLVFFGCWIAIEAVGHAYSAYLNGLQVVPFQLILASAFAATTFLAMWFAIDAFGSPGAIAARVVCYLIVVILPYLIFDWSRRRA